jgi:hypothetical protein
MFVLVLRLPFTALHYTWDSVLLLSHIFVVAYQYPFLKWNLVLKVQIWKLMTQ